MNKRHLLAVKSGLLAFFLATMLPTTALAQQSVDQWTFDESSGTTAANSVAGRADGTLTSGASFVPGVSGNAVYLPPNESVNFGGSTGNLGTSDFTISFWLKTVGAGTVNFAEVLGNRGAEGSAGTPYIDFRMGAAGWLSLEVTGYSNSGYVRAVTNPNDGTVNDGNWHLITGLRQGIQVRIYVDGVLRATADARGTTVADVQSLYQFAAGANANTTTYGLQFDGMIDDLQIYGWALSEFELATPSRQVAFIMGTVAGYNLHPGIATALTAKLTAALADINNGGDMVMAANVLRAFLNQCNAQSGKNLTTQQANKLIALVTTTIASLP